MCDIHCNKKLAQVFDGRTGKENGSTYAILFLFIHDVYNFVIQNFSIFSLTFSLTLVTQYLSTIPPLLYIVVFTNKRSQAKVSTVYLSYW